jgi:hypothetical protein
MVVKLSRKETKIDERGVVTLYSKNWSSSVAHRTGSCVLFCFNKAVGS